MRLRFLILAALFSMCCGGCSGVPFQRAAYVPLGPVQPEAVREEFSRSIPAKFQVISTVVFRYGWQTMTVLGYTSVDQESKLFTVVGLSPVGIKLFEVSGDADTVLHEFAIQEFTRRGNFIEAMAEDIRRIYFDRVPAPDAKAHKKKDRIIFRKSTASGKVEYIFGGEHNALVEKRYYKDDERMCTISYHEYRLKDGKLYPAGILLKHHQYGYRLAVRLKEIRP